MAVFRYMQHSGYFLMSYSPLLRCVSEIPPQLMLPLSLLCALSDKKTTTKLIFKKT